MEGRTKCAPCHGQGGPTCSRCGVPPVVDQTVIALDGEPELRVCEVCGGVIGEDGEPFGHRVTVIVLGESLAHPPEVPGDDE